MDKWLSALLPAAVSSILPGIGNTIGSTLTGALGLGDALGQTGSNVIGNALVGGGLGYLTGGNGKSALTGAVVGGGIPLALSALGAPGGLGDLFGGGANASAAASNATGGLRDSNIVAGGQTGGNAGGQTSNLFGSMFGGGNISKLAPLMMIGATLAQAGSKPKGATPPSTMNNPNADPNMTARLSQVEFNRKQNPYDFDAFKYGYGGQRQFFQNNQLPKMAARGGPIGYAEGGAGLGAVSRYVAGPGTGRSDDIPALLSDGEYVIDAETVALLGDGSSRAGAERLDQFHQNVRKHKAAGLAKGQMSRNAKAPERYMGAA